MIRYTELGVKTSMRLLSEMVSKCYRDVSPVDCRLSGKCRQQLVSPMGRSAAKLVKLGGQLYAP